MRVACLSSSLVSFGTGGVIKNLATLLTMASALDCFFYKNLLQEQEKGKEIKRLEQTGTLCAEEMRVEDNKRKIWKENIIKGCVRDGKKKTDESEVLFT